MIEGVDYAFSRPPVSALVAAGKRFAVRYGGAGTSDKWLTMAEADDLSEAGIAIVANVEGSASGLLGGRSVGERWATNAYSQFTTIGMPRDRPIYLSVDFDVQSGQWPAVADALRGAASAIGIDRVGVYGGRRAIEWARRDGLARWFWQTYAWSGNPTRWVAGNHLEQYRNGVRIGGADCDLNRSLTVDYGQWYTTPQEEPVADIDPQTDIHAWRQAQRIEALTQLLDPNAAGEPMPVVELLRSLPTKTDPIPIEISAESAAILAAALAPILAGIVEDTLSRLSIVVRPGI